MRDYSSTDFRKIDRKIRFELVGCGRISKNHVNALKHYGDTGELVAVCDIDPHAAEEAAAMTGARPYASLDELLAESNADAVILCTPSGLHSVQAIQVAEAGRHVITEKPMAARRDDGKRVVAACDHAPVRREAEPPQCHASSAEEGDRSLLVRAGRHEAQWVQGALFTYSTSMRCGTSS